jgi:hypothetical protein
VPASALTALLSGPDGVPLAAALGDLPSPEVAEILVVLESAAPTRAVRKEIRRALYRLRQRGVPVPEPPSAPAAPALGAAAEDAEGFVSAIDGRGDRLVWILRGLAGGGALLIEAVMNEPAGLHTAQAHEVSRKQVRTARRQMEHETGLRFVAADWRILDALLVEAHERAAGRERAPDYLTIRPRLTADPPLAPTELVSSRLAPPSDEEAATLAAASANLLDEPELRGWYPPPDALKSFVEEIGAVEASPLIVSRAAQEERVREVIRRAAQEVYPAPVLARRLAATAYVLAESGREPVARRALAVAAVLRQRPAAISEVPFAVLLVERAVAPLLAERTKHQQEAERSSLVVTPGQVLRDRESSRPGRTRG